MTEIRTEWFAKYLGLFISQDWAGQDWAGQGMEGKAQRLWH